MRIHVHDFSGHPFQAQLSRELARRGHVVEHSFSTRYTSGKGILSRLDTDPPTLSFHPIDAGVRLDKYRALRRLLFELGHTRAWLSRLDRQAPDIVIACNVPLVALRVFAAGARRRALPWVLWHQDLFSNAMGDELDRRLPPLAAAVARRVLERIERSCVASANEVVAISDEFVRAYRAWGLPTEHVRVIPNWAPTDEIVPTPRDNKWSRSALGNDNEFRLLYAGTLGRKHNPCLLVQLLSDVRSSGLPARLIVVSEGEGAEAVRRAASSAPGPVTVLPFQPAEQLANVLGAADILLCLLEPSASRFSVPSKVLSYLAAGRPVAGLMPSDNPAAGDILSVGGSVEPPTGEGAQRTAEWIAQVSSNRQELQDLGRRSRSLAVSRFGIAQIATQFLDTVSSAALQAPHGRTSRALRGAAGV